MLHLRHFGHQIGGVDQLLRRVAAGDDDMCHMRFGGERFEHFIEPTGLYFPSADNNFSHPEFVPWIALVSMLALVVGAGSAYLWYWKGKGPHGITERNKLARTGYKVLENKYYLDWLYTDVIVGFVKGPFAKATNWFNQNILDGIVNAVGKGRTRVEVVSKKAMSTNFLATNWEKRILSALDERIR